MTHLMRHVMSPTLRARLNTIHRSFWRNAVHNTIQQRTRTEADILSRMPAMYRGKPKKKGETPATDTQPTE